MPDRAELVAELREWLQIHNVRAFLRVIRFGESSQDLTAYRLHFGGSTFDSFADHPRVVITKPGYSSTAAGAYQFLAKTWDGLVKKYGFLDFSPENQDLAAVALIKGRNAISDVIDGRLEQALAKCSWEWASLPPSRYKQPTRSLEQCRTVFIKYGGTLDGGAEVSLKATNVAATATPEKPVAPFLAAALPVLLQAAPDLIRLFGKGASSERNAVVAEKVGAVAMQITGAVNEQEAATRIQADPAAAEAFRKAVAENFDQWMGMVVKFGEMDEASKAKAREFALAYHKEPVVGKFSFIEFLSLLMLLISAAGAGYVLYDDKFPAEIKGAVVTLVLIGGWTGVKEFWLGSSMGSMRKDNARTP